MNLSAIRAIRIRRFGNRNLEMEKADENFPRRPFVAGVHLRECHKQHPNIPPNNFPLKALSNTNEKQKGKS